MNMNVAMIIPTGIGCSIGGHAGDANPAARMLASVVDNLLLHPNAVNASDLNEMTDNSWYIEGSILDRFLDGQFFLKRPRSNRILIVCNDAMEPATVNSANASMKTLGTDIRVIQLDTELKMVGYLKDDHAAGDITGVDELISQIRPYDFDALAIHTKVDVEVDTAMNYLHCGGINPYGAVEARLSRYVADHIDKPVAHAPVEELEEPYLGIVDPRMAASTISACYLNSVLKGLHRSPQIYWEQRLGALHARDIEAMVAPANCYGLAHLACKKMNIPVIGVQDNRTTLKQKPKCDIIVNNYLEAVGVIIAMKAGINLQSIMTKELYKAKFIDPYLYGGDIHGCSA
jgi:hypothetical protein